MAEETRRIVTWDEYRKDVHSLADLLREQLLPDYRKEYQPHITGIPRGGLIIAVSLSHLLDLHFVPYPYIGVAGNARDLIICDDIFSTGKTFENDLVHVFNKTRTYEFGKRITVSLYRDSKFPHLKPDYCLKTVDEWLVFPWETHKTSQLDRLHVTDSV